MSLLLSQTTYTLAEYLAFEEANDEKHEYLAGHIYAMAGGSPAHNQICFNLSACIGSRIQGTDCRGYSSDQKIWIEAAQIGTYGDITIVCGEPRFHERHKTLLLNPRVIIEILSPSTEAYDRGDKWAYYQQLSSLTDYLLVAQQRTQIEHFALDRDGSWRYTSETNPTSDIILASINCRIPLAQVYVGIEFPSAPTRPPIQNSSE